MDDPYSEHMETILVPLDGSPLAEEALPHALGLARRYGAELLLLGVADDDETHALQQYLVQTQMGLAESGLEVRQLVVAGHASEQIVRRAHEEPALMLVMRSHGRRGLRRLWLGSVTDKVMREAPCPVLIVHGPVQPDPTYRRILVPLDGSSRAESALTAAAFLARVDGGSLQLVRVLDLPVPFYRDQPPLDWTPNVSAEVQADCLSYLEDQAAPLRALELSVEVTTRRGSPAEEVLELAGQAELVVLATHSRSWIERALLGSVASRVAHHANCPVLLIPTGREDLDLESRSSKLMEVSQ